MRPLYGLRPWSRATAVIVLLCAIAISSAPALAQSGTASSSVVPSNSTPEVGEQITATISIDVTDILPPDNALGSFTATLDWNPAVLEYDSNSGILAGFGGVINDTQVSSGHLVFNGAKATGATGSTTVLTVAFDVVGSGSSDLNLEFSAMSAAYTFKNLLPLLTVYDGQVQVGPSQTYSLSIAVQPPEGGITDPEAGDHSYAEGTVVNVTIVPNASYEFDHWDGACAGSGPCQVTMDADKAVTAILAELPLSCHVLTLSHTGQGSDPVATPTNSTGCPTGRYVEGETIGLSGAVPDPGWHIGGWIGTSDDDSTADTNSLIMPASAHTVTVTYKHFTYLPIGLRRMTPSERELGQAMIQQDASIGTAPSSANAAAVVGDSAPTSVQMTAEEGGELVGPPIAVEAPTIQPIATASHSAGAWEQPAEEDVLMPVAGQSGGSDTSPASRRIPITGALDAREPLLWGLGLVCLSIPLAALVLSTLLLVRQKSVGG